MCPVWPWCGLECPWLLAPPTKQCYISFLPFENPIFVYICLVFNVIARFHQCVVDHWATYVGVSPSIRLPVSHSLMSHCTVISAPFTQFPITTHSQHLVGCNAMECSLSSLLVTVSLSTRMHTVHSNVGQHTSPISMNYAISYSLANRQLVSLLV